MDNDTNVIGERVRELRVALGLTQEALADRGGIDRTYVVHVEAGRNKATSSLMRVALAKGFGLGLEDSNRYLDGEIGLATAKRMARATGAAA